MQKDWHTTDTASFEGCSVLQTDTDQAISIHSGEPSFRWGTPRLRGRAEQCSYIASPPIGPNLGNMTEGTASRTAPACRAYGQHVDLGPHRAPWLKRFDGCDQPGKNCPHDEDRKYTGPRLMEMRERTSHVVGSAAMSRRQYEAARAPTGWPRRNQARRSDVCRQLCWPGLVRGMGVRKSHFAPARAKCARLGL